MSISVVIPSTLESLPKDLEAALARQTVPAREVIHVYDEHRQGAAWARNRGIEKAAGHIVACIDDDCVPPDDWLATISETMTDYDADVVGGTYDELDPFLRDRRRRQGFPCRTGPDDHGQVGAGGNIAYRMSTLLLTRWRDGYFFNESFRMSQDWELIWRLRDQGARVVYMAKPVSHSKTMSSFAYLRQQFSRGIGIAMLNRARLRLGNGLVTHKSVLWSNPESSRARVLLQVVWHKVIGPVDWQSFSTLRNFTVFWLGEKLQGLGFLWAESPRFVSMLLKRSRVRWQSIIARHSR